VSAGLRVQLFGQTLDIGPLRGNHFLRCKFEQSQRWKEGSNLYA
jgi:hypothetical protein